MNELSLIRSATAEVRMARATAAKTSCHATNRIGGYVPSPVSRPIPASPR